MTAMILHCSKDGDTLDRGYFATGDRCWRLAKQSCTRIVQVVAEKKNRGRKRVNSKMYIRIIMYRLEWKMNS